MKDKVEQAILTLSAIFSILVVLLDWLRILPLPPDVILSLTLLGVGLMTGYLVLERRSKLENIERLLIDGTERIIRSLDGVAVQSFPDRQDVYQYAMKRMKEAQRSIDDLTWGAVELERSQPEKEEYKKYIKTISAVCKKEKVHYREVMSFPPLRNVDRAKATMQENLSGYELRYYQFKRENMPALLSFMVIDSEEVILGFYRSGPLTIEREIRLAVKHPAVSALFQDYYDTIWQGARILKEGDEAHYDTLEDIGKSLSQKE